MAGLREKPLEIAVSESVLTTTMVYRKGKSPAARAVCRRREPRRRVTSSMRRSTRCPTGREYAD
jgi:hypothetical protein